MGIVLIISKDDVAVATPDDVTIVPFDCPSIKAKIINNKDFPLDLGGWKVSELGGDLYRIPDKTIVAPGDSIIVWSGIGKNDAHNFYIGKDTWALSNQSSRVDRPDGKVKVSFYNMECAFNK